MNTYWMSFAPDDGPCAGVVIIDAKDEIEAVRQSHRLGINPGGQVLIALIPPDRYDAVVGPYGKDRLIPLAELKANGEKRLGDTPPEFQEAVDKAVDRRCGGG